MAVHELCFLPNGVLTLPRSRVIYGDTERRADAHARLQRPHPALTTATSCTTPASTRTRPTNPKALEGHHAQRALVHRGGRRAEPPARRGHDRGQDRDGHRVTLPLRPRRRTALLQATRRSTCRTTSYRAGLPSRHGDGPRPPQAVLRPSARLPHRHGRHRDRAGGVGAVRRTVTRRDTRAFWWSCRTAAR